MQIVAVSDEGLQVTIGPAKPVGCGFLGADPEPLTLPNSSEFVA
jgi:hypothetical protein